MDVLSRMSSPSNRRYGKFVLGALLIKTDNLLRALEDIAHKGGYDLPPESRDRPPSKKTFGKRALSDADTVLRDASQR